MRGVTLLCAGRELALEGCQFRVTVCGLQSSTITGKGRKSHDAPRLTKRCVMKPTCGSCSEQPAPTGRGGVISIDRVACVQLKHASASSWPTKLILMN